MRNITFYSCMLFLSLISFQREAIAQNVIDSRQLLLGASHAFTGNLPVSSITLTGEATWIVGPSNETGSVTMVARADGSSTFELVLSTGTRTESQSTFADGQSCTWSDGDGTVYSTPAHNCMVPVAWFLPEVALFSSQLTAAGAFSGASTGNSNEVALLWSLIPPAGTDVDAAALLSHIGAFDLQLSASSLLPTSMAYSQHPDHNAGVDIPVTVVYSDYRVIEGAAVPYHIQRFVNGVLALDIFLNNAVVAH